jgi:hypothetical protein
MADGPARTNLAGFPRGGGRARSPRLSSPLPYPITSTGTVCEPYESLIVTVSPSSGRPAPEL